MMSVQASLSWSVHPSPRITSPIDSIINTRLPPFPGAVSHPKRSSSGLAQDQGQPEANRFADQMRPPGKMSASLARVAAPIAFLSGAQIAR